MGDNLPPEVWVALTAIGIVIGAAAVTGALVIHRLTWGRK